jgi:hypothetical protein
MKRFLVLKLSMDNDQNQLRMLQKLPILSGFQRMDKVLQLKELIRLSVLISP